LLDRAPALHRYLTSTYEERRDEPAADHLLLFRAGEAKLNPFPVFWVSKLTEDLVGGIIGQVVLT